MTVFFTPDDVAGRSPDDRSAVSCGAMASDHDPAAEPAAEPGKSGGDSPLRAFFGLFVVPLLVVLACVVVFVGFGWIAYDRQTTGDYLNDLRSGWKPRRAQAAYELSKILIADPGALDDEPGAREEMRALFQEIEDVSIRRYLALILGYTRDEESVPLLVEAVRSDDAEMRIYALWALGTIGDPRARPPLLEALVDADPGLRKTAAFALGEMGDRESVAPLRRLLEDPIADVRWNAALALARLDDETAIPVLRRMLDRALVDQVPGIRPEQQEEAMVSAVRALAALDRQGSRQLFDRLARDDPSLKVRQAAIEARGD
jgi:HEAT repeat protein